VQRGMTGGQGERGRVLEHLPELEVLEVGSANADALSRLHVSRLLKRRSMLAQ
jgi:hypothetical protein